MKTVFIISDSTGETAERMVRAATLQFSVPVQVRTYSRVRLESECEQIIEKAVEVRALVVFTVVNPEARELLTKLVERHGVDAVDLMGALIAKLGGFLGSAPAGVPGLLHTIGEDYFRRIEAVEFAVKNDDGAEPRNLPKADLVLVGISRTSKTPLSTYLAQRGLKVANVPLVLGVDPPEELSKVDDRRVFGLVVNPDTLMRIRQNRLSHLGMPADASYGQRGHIETEIGYSREIFRKHPNWPVIDVTNRAIEETAADILRIYQERVLG
ncbi:MAG: kinase/pyrophosphorylase [Kofleriaceae bacterium]|jgi:regulator of PEP synthase PpsR (kinase-PPPase family)|nr:kinase/pyrophosphorylase [Kofleriaceae bacterium]MBP6840180.1 kinase/pyrophosphorylase [Kofleriaceae bacterium]MBP9204883.1 kinase/pyrophosphorylase [Kofleriaceae bacterium]